MFGGKSFLWDYKKNKVVLGMREGLKSGFICGLWVDIYTL